MKTEELIKLLEKYPERDVNFFLIPNDEELAGSTDENDVSLEFKGEISTSSNFIELGLAFPKIFKEKHYYLFGSEACTILDNEGLDALINKINNEDFTEFDTRCHSVLDNPADILFQSMGWGNYSVLTEEEYNKFHENIN